jgi:hypothetical protein
MKQAEIKNDTDYIIGPPNNLFEGAGYGKTTDNYIPHRMSHVRVVDNRVHKIMSGYYRSENNARLVGEGEKPDRSLYTVGPLVRGVKLDGTLSDQTFVVRPQEVRMEWDAWREAFAREHVRLKEQRAQRIAHDREVEAANAVMREERERRLKELNDLLEGSRLEAKGIGGNIVLTGDPEDLRAAAEKISKVVVP